jgi:choline-sulfatase
VLSPEHGVRNNKGYALPGRFWTLAERLKAKGYATGGVASSMVLRRATGIDQGFDFYDDPAEVRLRDPTLAFAQRRGEASVVKAQRWLDAREPGAPFFLFLHLFEPHAPYDPPEPFASRYAERPYDGEVAYTDGLVGQFLEHLKQRQLYDRSLVILLSDHGEGLGDHVEQEHGLLLYREALQVPLMVKLPGQARAGERVERVVGLVDVLPTILDLLGLEREGLPGHALLAPGGPPAERVLYSETFFGLEQYGFAELRSALQDDAHYIQAPRPELYDLVRDPAEERNLLPDKRPPAQLLRALAAVGEGARALAAVSPEEAERLAALGYIGGPGGEEPPVSDRPDPKDKVHLVVEFWANVARLGKTDSLVPETRVRELMEELGIRSKSESITRAVAHNFLRAGRPQAAAELMAGFSDSKVADTQLTLGEIAAALERPDAARRHFERALALDPSHAGGYRDLGVLLLAAGRGDEAWNALGVVHARAGRKAAAIDAWRRAVAADPELADTWRNLSLVLLETGDRVGAREALERYAALVQGSERRRAEAELARLGGR